MTGTRRSCWAPRSCSAAMRRTCPATCCLFSSPARTPCPGGARAMVREGALGRARGVLSLHLNPLFSAGTVALREGWATCSSVSFRLRLQGRGGHVADPGHALNPLLPAAALLTAAEELRRELAAEAEPLILAFGSLHGGTAANVIPETVEASGSLRAPSPELLQGALARFRELARTITEKAGARFQLEIEEGYPPVFNDPALSAAFREAAATVVGSESVTSLDRPLATGDDVAFFHREVPGVYWQLGCADPTRGFAHPLHSPRFDFGEELLALGAAVQARAVLSLPAAKAEIPWFDNRRAAGYTADACRKLEPSGAAAAFFMNKPGVVVQSIERGCPSPRQRFFLLRSPTRDILQFILLMAALVWLLSPGGLTLRLPLGVVPRAPLHPQAGRGPAHRRAPAAGAGPHPANFGNQPGAGLRHRPAHGLAAPVRLAGRARRGPRLPGADPQHADAGAAFRDLLHPRADPQHRALHLRSVGPEPVRGGLRLGGVPRRNRLDPQGSVAGLLQPGPERKRIPTAS